MSPDYRLTILWVSWSGFSGKLSTTTMFQYFANFRNFCKTLVGPKQLARNIKQNCTVGFPIFYVELHFPTIPATPSFSFWSRLWCTEVTEPLSLHFQNLYPPNLWEIFQLINQRWVSCVGRWWSDGRPCGPRPVPASEAWKASPLWIWISGTSTYIGNSAAFACINSIWSQNNRREQELF